MRWLTNIEERASRPGLRADLMYGEGHSDWLRGKHIGEPRATETYTVAQLKAIGMVGVYAIEEDDGHSA